jgi:hypothetical protein
VLAYRQGLRPRGARELDELFGAERFAAAPWIDILIAQKAFDLLPAQF